MNIFVQSFDLIKTNILKIFCLVFFNYWIENYEFTNIYILILVSELIAFCTWSGGRNSWWNDDPLLI